MNPRTLLVIVLAGVCGLSAMVLVQGLRGPSGPPAVEKTPVVYAAADVKPGETLTESMLEVRQMPIGEVPEDAIRKVADAVDRAAMSQLDTGDMLRGKKLADKGAGRGMAALVRPGMRAFTIQTPSFSASMAGFLLPGNKVDVLLTVSSNGGPQDETGGGVTTTLLQNVEILAVHTTVSTPSANKINPDEARSVTLQVTPEQAGKLDLGQNKGTLHLSLRNLKDPAGLMPKPVTMADLAIPGIIPGAGASPPPREMNDVLDLQIPPGKRAFMIKTSANSSSLVGLLSKGKRVDVLLTTHLDPDKGTTSTLLKNVQVLATYESFKRAPDAKLDAEDVRTVTLLVTPEEAEQLDLSEKVGTLHLSLRDEKEENGGARLPLMAADLHRGIAIQPIQPIPLLTRTMRGTVVGKDLLLVNPGR